MSEGQPQAITKRPPHGSGTSEPNRAVSVTVTATSTAAISCVPDGYEWGGAWVTFVPEVDVYIRFGDINVLAATASDVKLTAGNAEPFWICRPEDAYFRMIRVASDGPVKRYRSS